MLLDHKSHFGSISTDFGSRAVFDPYYMKVYFQKFAKNERQQVRIWFRVFFDTLFQAS